MRKSGFMVVKFGISVKFGYTPTCSTWLAVKDTLEKMPLHNMNGWLTRDVKIVMLLVLCSATTLSIPLGLFDSLRVARTRNREPLSSVRLMRLGPSRPLITSIGEIREIFKKPSYNVNLVHFLFLDNLQISGFSQGSIIFPH